MSFDRSIAIKSNDKITDTGFVVIGRNEGQRLVRCLQSLKSTKNKLIYVDSGSTDGSQLVAKAAGTTVVSLDMALPFTAARARNQGFKKLLEMQPKTEYVQFIDGDCILDAGWLMQARQFLIEHPGVVAVCGRRREMYPDASVYNWMCDTEWATPIGEIESCGGDVLVRTHALLELGGYLEFLVAGEEPELCIRLRETGWKVWRISAEMTLHDAAITRFSQWWRRCKRGGYGMCQVAKLHIKSKHGMWKKSVMRALIYGSALPVVALLGLAYPAFWLMLLMYPILVSRIAIQRGYNNKDSWVYALMITIAKFAEFGGVLSFLTDIILRRSRSIIEYK
jgi:GT2 family glycosyltransferase